MRVAVCPFSLLSIFVCICNMYMCMLMFLCLHVATLMPQHMLAVRGQTWMSIFTVHLVETVFNFVVQRCIHKAGWTMSSRDSLVPASHLILEKLGLPACTIIPDFMWILGIRTYVQKHIWLVFYPPHHLPSTVLFYIHTIEMSTVQVVEGQGSLLPIFELPTVDLFGLFDGDASWLPYTFTMKAECSTGKGSCYLKSYHKISSKVNHMAIEKNKIFISGHLLGKKQLG